MTNEEKELIKEIRELKTKVAMVMNKINALHQLSPKNAEMDKAFQHIEETFRGLPETKVDYDSDRAT